MDAEKKLYASGMNPLSIQPSRSLPKEVAVIGAGTIGPDIGYYIKSALPGIKLVLVDVAEAPLKNAEKRCEGYAKKAVEKKKMKEDKAREVLQNIVYTVDYRQIENCDLVIEAATESIPLKQRIFESVENIVRGDAVITSNTSSIPADRIFDKMKRPERSTITHFFGPAWRSLPVEVIRWEKTGPEVMDYLLWFFAQTGKVPIVTDNVSCFMLDRVFINWTDQSARLLDPASASQVDKVAEEFVGGGPFYVLNMTNGNLINVEATALLKEEGEHYESPRILLSVDRWLTHKPGAQVEVPDELKRVIRDRLLGTLFSQTFDIIDRGIGTKGDLNYGCQMALGFKKGPLDLMRDLGESEVRRIVKKFEADRPGFPQPRSPISSYQDFKRFLLVDDVDGAKVITLRRPEALNAISDEINNEILSVLKTYAEDPKVAGFVITGYGTRAFSAGADIGKFPQTLGDKEAARKYAMDCSQVQLYMDQMKKPVVAAVNGMALGGGFEIAIRCHGMVAMKNAFFQLPEITLGIIPGIGGCIVPYRKWPKGGRLFHEMITVARAVSAKEAFEIGMVSKVVDDYPTMIRAAVDEVKNLQGKIERIPDGKVEIPEFSIPDPPLAGKLPLSREVITIIMKTIRDGAAAATFAEALEIGYRGNAEAACTEAAREGISAFLEKKRPDFKK